jgi:hypothetical protein
VNLSLLLYDTQLLLGLVGRHTENGSVQDREIPQCQNATNCLLLLLINCLILALRY